MFRGTLDQNRRLINFIYRTFTLYGGSFQILRLLIKPSLMVMSTTPAEETSTGLGSSPFARRYLGNRFFFLFLGVLRGFSSPSVPSTTYLFSRRYLKFTLGGFPHSEIHGSKPACGSPRHIVAYHVLHRLLVPRHSPYALKNLTGEMY